MNHKIVPIISLCVFILAACTQGQEKQTIGTIVGAGLGAVLGSQVGSGKGRLAGVAIGALAGAWIGGETGKNLDEADKLKAQQTAQNALEHNQSGQTSSWQNPDSGNSGSYTPTSSYKSNNKDCRDFESTVTIDGEQETSQNRACRNEDGTWHVVP